MFKTIMIIAATIVALGWIAYGIWALKIRADEKNKPRKPSERLQDARRDVADYARKVKEFQKPAPKADKNKVKQQ